MSKTLFNVTRLLAQEEIEIILDEQSYDVREEFARHDLYRDLLAYVLSKVQNVYRAIDEDEKTSIKSYFILDSAERKLDRELAIYQGIYACLKKIEKGSEVKGTFREIPTAAVLVRS